VPVASHVPLVIAAEDDAVVLSGHLARPNTQWQSFGAGEALVIFTGPHAYVSPALYEKRESVPTWNYIAVHAYGVPEALSPADAPDELRAALEALIAAHDGGYREQWDSLPTKYRDGMLQGIVGFRMRVTRLEGKWKLSQNRSLHDQQSVAAALGAAADPTISAVGQVMTERLAARTDDAAGA
jgi:transcriptional regulator